MICNGATNAAIHIAMENILRAPALVGSRSRCQAPTPPTASEVVRNAAITVCTKRNGKLGLKIMSSHEPLGTNCPTALTANPVGVCIQLFAAKIQVAEIKVPSATCRSPQSAVSDPPCSTQTT